MEKLRVHWETQYRKVVEEPSCIRRPDTGQQQRGFRVLYREPQYKRKRVTVEYALGPFALPSHLIIHAHVLGSPRAQTPFHSLARRFRLYWGSRYKTRKPFCCCPVSGLLIHDGSSTTFLYMHKDIINSFHFVFFPTPLDLELGLSF
jgi:hypothetical protein